MKDYKTIPPFMEWRNSTKMFVLAFSLFMFFAVAESMLKDWNIAFSFYDHEWGIVLVIALFVI